LIDDHGDVGGAESRPVSNVINLADFASERHLVGLFADPEAHTHAVQFYEEESFLFDTVAHFIAAGLKGDDHVVVIATNAHRTGFLHRVGPAAADPAIDEGRLTLLDAEETLARFMVGGMPDPDLFREVLARLMTTAEGEASPRRIRAYGEMVDLLWRQGNSTAAIRLEELWGEATQAHSLTLLCAYLMGNFYREGDSEQFMQVCRNHSHVIPTEKFGRADDAHARLREISLLQQRAHALESEIGQRKQLEGALRNALRERTKIEEDLRASVKREKEARLRAEASDAFKEMFIGILGHDLRNPLNTILTTARLMSMRQDASPAERDKKLGRVVASGIRMQRMIEQLLDLTRARLADGIPVQRGEERDLAALVTKIVDEIRTANPTRTIELVTEPCAASVDADRLEQVVSNLLANAVIHGDSAQRIHVELAARGELASISVHNFGTPIDADLMPRLFDPFQRAGRQPGCAEGLGLGLYISERIVSGHGGKIEVHSTKETGTRFEITFPRR
jgi:signal transduction histidine kinase